MSHAAQKEVHFKREREEEEEEARKVRPKGGQVQVMGRGKGKALVPSSVATDKARPSGPWCRTCNQPHSESTCHRHNRTCFGCGSPGHLRKDCPNPSPIGYHGGQGSGGHPRGGGRAPSFNRGRAGGRTAGRRGGRAGVFAAEVEHTGEEQPHDVAPGEMLSGTVSISGHLAFVLFDTGYSHLIVSRDFVESCGWVMEKRSDVSRVLTPLGQSNEVVLGCRNLKVLIAGRELFLDVLVLDISGYDFLL
ncbi:hypothetical protein LUZ61_007249 [Rhynchospora tenuis]|uniref:CCHC-type domain-containing protein n=1 Tax=Rhynchospora tenuis TaxID=198213 RepID=A0AAD5ZTB4_9POAL|nr:hypothetical protein LUZ61_007249 [Rhynchospora tenuis]